MKIEQLFELNKPVVEKKKYKKKVGSQPIEETGLGDFRLHQKVGTPQDLVRDLKAKIGKGKIAKLLVTQSEYGDTLTYAFESKEHPTEAKERPKGKTDDSDIDIKMNDPRSNYALKKARAKNSQADSDLEAFIKSMDDEQNQDDVDINQLQAQIDGQQDQINDLKQQFKKIKLGEQEDIYFECVRVLNGFKQLNEDFDWEPQPAFAGAAVKHEKEKLSPRDIDGKVQRAWNMAIQEYKNAFSPKVKSQYRQQMNKIIGIAQRANIALDPDPESLGI